jgi:NADPH2:quinone reductase
MKAMLARSLGEPTVLEYADVAEPTAGPGEVLVDVRAIGCNFFDILIVQGKYQKRPPLPFSPGSEVAGVVRAVGAGVEAFRPGQRVFATMSYGAYAEAAAVSAAHVYPLPDALDFSEGAAFALVYQTAYCALVRRAALQPGETLLVHAAAGGVGLAAVQLGRALGARVIATAGSPEKLEIARTAGAEVLLDYRRDDWVERVKAETGGAGADVIYDPVGGDVFDGSTRCLAFEGRLCLIGFTSGRIPDIAANRILLKNVSIVGVHWGLYNERDPALVRQWMRELLARAEKGQLRPVIFKTFPLRDAAQALTAIGSRESYGKVVLVPS